MQTPNGIFDASEKSCNSYLLFVQFLIEIFLICCLDLRDNFGNLPSGLIMNDRRRAQREKVRTRTHARL